MRQSNSMRLLVILGTLVLLVAAVYAAPAEDEETALDNVDEDEDSDLEELLEDSALHELEGNDEDPAKRRRKPRKEHDIHQSSSSDSSAIAKILEAD